VVSTYPYWEYGNKYYVWDTFYKSLELNLKEYIIRNNYHITDKLHIDKNKIINNDVFHSFYIKYIDSFDYENFISIYCRHIDDIIIIPLTDTDKTLLANKFKIRQYREINITNKDFNDLYYRIDKIIHDYSNKWFVRLSSNSAKRDVPITPLDSTLDILDLLTKSKTFYLQEYTVNKASNIILIPYNNIQPSNEFRLFVCNKKITAATQQVWYRKFNYNKAVLNNIIEAINSYSLDDIPSMCVLDTYFDGIKLKLIEINPWICAGSGLYDYDRDHNILFGMVAPQLRIIE